MRGPDLNPSASGPVLNILLVFILCLVVSPADAEELLLLDPSQVRRLTDLAPKPPRPDAAKPVPPKSSLHAYITGSGPGDGDTNALVWVFVLRGTAVSERLIGLDHDLRRFQGQIDRYLALPAAAPRNLRSASGKRGLIGLLKSQQLALSAWDDPALSYRARELERLAGQLARLKALGDRQRFVLRRTTLVDLSQRTLDARHRTRHELSALLQLCEALQRRRHGGRT